MRALAVRCPLCRGTSFDESGTNDQFLRFKCLCVGRNGNVILRYRCMWRRAQVLRQARRNFMQ